MEIKISKTSLLRVALVVLISVVMGSTASAATKNTSKKPSKGEIRATVKPRITKSTSKPVRLLVPATTSTTKGSPSKKPLTGQDFYKQLLTVSSEEREQRIEIAATSGMIPPSFRRLTDVTISGVDANGKPHKLTYRVAPDYLAIGTDQDPFRVPMRPATAQRIADALGFLLPTRKMVNDIYSDAVLTLQPKFLQVSRAMVGTPYFWKHNQIIEGQLSGQEKGLLSSGQKKDIVVAKALKNRPYQVAIYGWHDLRGEAVQPLSLVHDERYVDYSHGVRLISRVAILDGNIVDLQTIMRDRNLAPLVSDEGALSRVNYSITSGQRTKPRK